MNRRTYLAVTGAVTAALAGCSSDESGTGGSSPSDEGETPTPTDMQPPSSTPADGDTPAAGGETAATDTRPETESATVAGEEIHESYETTEVRVVTPDGELLGSVTAAIADTKELRFLGLSDTESLPPSRGMLFVFESVGDHTFVMREMDFGIDIVYADADGTITRIHHAPAPGPDEDGSNQRYPGRGQYVLEVVYKWTSDRGVSEGDRLEFSLPG